MSDAKPQSLDQIGDAAGQVWQCLSKNGAMSVTQLVKQMKLPRDQVMQGLGWLAREDKVRIQKGSRGRSVSLNELNP